MKPFCVLPYVQFSTTVSGDYQACCIAKQQKENIIDISPLEFFNSNHMKQLRYDMLQENISPLIKDTCYKCIINEKNTGNSKRLQKKVKLAIFVGYHPMFLLRVQSYFLKPQLFYHL